MPEELPVVKAAKTKIKVRARLEAFGREGQDGFRLIRPNQVVSNDVMSGEGGTVDVTKLNRYLMAHIHPDERAAFEQAIKDDDGVDIDYLSDLMEQMTKVLYEDLPTKP